MHRTRYRLTIQLPSHRNTDLKPIEQIKAGDLVWTRNPRNGKVELKPVTATMIRQVHAVVSVQLADTSGKVVQTITATNEHPFFVTGKGWVGAAHLGIGTEIVTRAGPRLIVKSVTPHRRPAGYAVYNFTVGQDHSYFVGTAGGGAWVHNGCFPKTPEEMDGMMGFEGRRVPDGPTTSGRGKVEWEFGGGRGRIRYEQHPYDHSGSGWNPRHHGPHFHVEWGPGSSGRFPNKAYPPGYTPGMGTGFLPGENMP